MTFVRRSVVICVVICICGEVESDGRGKALTQSDTDAICSIVKKLRELSNNATHNMKFGGKIVENGEKTAAYYTTRVGAKEMFLKVLEKVIPEEEEEDLTELEKVLGNIEGLRGELDKTVTSMNASLWAMRSLSWSLVNTSDSYAYWMKDMVFFFDDVVAGGSGTCCLVADGGATDNCTIDNKGGSVPTDCTAWPSRQNNGVLAEYENPLNKTPVFNMGNAGNIHNYTHYGCYITTTNESYIRGKKSFIYELSGGLFNTSGNALVANFTSVRKEFQDLIDPLIASVTKISAGNTSITTQRAALDSLLVELEEKVWNILKRKEATKEVTETLGSIKHAPWNYTESRESDGDVTVQQNLSGITLFVYLFVVLWK